MRNTVIVLCLLMAAAVMAQTPQSNQPRQQEQQGLLSRLKARTGATQSSRIQHPAIQVAQPAASPQTFRPRATYPQRQAQRTPVQRPQYRQPGYPAYPPQNRTPYNMQQQPTGVRPTPTPTPTPTTSSSNSNSRSASSNSSSKDNDSSRSSKSSSNDDDDDNNSSKKSSSKSSSRSSSKSDEKSSDDDKDKKSSKSSSALEKIVKNVESNKSDEKSDKNKSDSDEKKAPKKTKEEIEAEKARAKMLKSADEATTVVASFLKYANDGYYDKAGDKLAPAIKKYFDSEISAVNGTKKVVIDELTANGTITMVTYVNTTVRGEGAVVEAELGYGDGRTVRRSFDLVKIDNDWKIVLPVTKAARAAAVQRPSSPAATPIPALPPPPTAEEAATQQAPPLVLAPVGLPDNNTSAPQQ